SSILPNAVTRVESHFASFSGSAGSWFLIAVAITFARHAPRLAACAFLSDSHLTSGATAEDATSSTLGSPSPLQACIAANNISNEPGKPTIRNREFLSGIKPSWINFGTPTIKLHPVAETYPWRLRDSPVSSKEKNTRLTQTANYM